MEQYTQWEIIEQLHKNPDINVLAVATTPWHALGVDAVLYHLQRQGIPLKGFIVVRAHQVTGTSLTEEQFIMKNAGDLKVVEVRLEYPHTTGKEKIAERFRKFNYYLTRKKRQCAPVLYWIRPVSPEYDLLPYVDTEEYQHRIQMLLTDEGLGTYFNSKNYWLKVAYLEGGWKQTVRAFEELYIYGTFLKNVIRKSYNMEEYFFLRWEKKRLCSNEEVTACYREALRLYHTKEDYSVFENAAVINTGPYEPFIRENDDLRVWEEASNVLAKHNIPVVVKPHPREVHVEKYEALNGIIEKRATVAQEMIMATLKELPICMIGFETTTLVTVHLLYNIPAICLNKLLHRDKLVEKNRGKDFMKVFQGVVLIPETIEEFEEMITKIEEENETK